MINLYFKDAAKLLFPIAIAIIYAIYTQLWWPLAILLGVFLADQVWQKWRLAHWLAKGNLLNPPHAKGLWENYYTRLMHLFRFEQRAQQELASIIQRARNSADNLDEGIVLLSPDNRLLYYNLAASELLDLVQADQGDKLTNLLREPIVHDYFLEKNFSKPLIVKAPWKDMMFSLKVTDLVHEGCFLRIQDVTKLHTLESLRRDFVANVSHELKTPLTVFKGSLELLQDSKEHLAPAQQKLINNMYIQSERMEKLVSSLLLLAKLEGYKSPKKSTISLTQLCNTLHATFSMKAAQKKQLLLWEIADNLQIQAVNQEIESAFSNLIENAIEHCPVGSTISVQCTQNSNEILFSVEDNGHGIEDFHFSHLTERFYRIDKSRGRTNHSTGTGLGLAIVKHTLQRHNSKLVIESKLGIGSRFSCKFNI